MSLLRIYGSLDAGPPQCRWAMTEPGRSPVHGEGALAQAPRGADRIQFVIPAPEMLLTRASLPQGAKRRAGAVLAFAVEDETVGDPEAQHAAWLGTADGADVLAVADKRGLDGWLAALESHGFRNCEVHCETLLLPRADGEWSLAWDGREGCVRTGDFEGGATDAGDAQSPPLSLALLLEAAGKRGRPPAAINVYATNAKAAPDTAAWQRVLGVPVRTAGQWDWRSASCDDSVNLMPKRRMQPLRADLAAKLRPAAWLAAAAIGIHFVALIADWALLKREQSVLRQQMESRFRAAVPDASAVVDPVLQMRRKLAEARHAAGIADSGDFLPMMEIAALALRELPAGTLRVAAYEQGRLSLELAGIDDAAARRFVARLLQNGRNIDAAIAPSRTGAGSFVVTVRVS